MRLLWGEVSPNLPLPDFGEAFRQRMAEKRNPQLRAASLSAWNLLAQGLKEMELPLFEVAYTETGKPFFTDSGIRNTDFSLIDSYPSLNLDSKVIFSSNFSLFFSISHSGNLAAALISDVPCGVDIEMVRPEVTERLYARCMHPAEIDAELDFFEAWTRKECIAKLDGRGMPARPCSINTLEYEGWRTEKLLDKCGNAYVLSAIAAADKQKAP